MMTILSGLRSSAIYNMIAVDNVRRVLTISNDIIGVDIQIETKISDGRSLISWSLLLLLL